MELNYHKYRFLLSNIIQESKAYFELDPLQFLTYKRYYLHLHK